MGRFLDKKGVIDRIKSYYSLKSNAELARFLGVAPNTITNWYGRKTFDIDIIYTKCVEVNLDWLFTGEGSMLRADGAPTNSVTLSTDILTPSSKSDESILYNMYKDLQAEKKEKESEIKELNAQMLKMSEEIGRLKAKLGEEKSYIEGLKPKTAKSVSLKEHSSQSIHDAPSVNAPSDI